MHKEKKIFFKIVSSYIEKNINLPKRQTLFSAGYDFESACEVVIKPEEIFLLPTGVKAFFPNDKVLLIYARSSLSIKKRLILANNVGVIDSDYYDNEKNEGHIFIPLYNFSKQDVLIKKHEKIAQGIFQNIYFTEDEVFQKNKKPIRKGGFGSTN
ncbi:dUTP diphosphatase [Candidatus Phytoplasma palmae]|uniref:dUTP diphosphatase n=1 Tax=Candidatus Phytoplasma palmae TaxID=85624 RepID=UPI003990CCD0